MPSQDDRWERKQAHYQDPEVVAAYEALRFTGLRSRGDTARSFRALERLLGDELQRVRKVLDVPCGTGRFAPFLSDGGRSLVQADLSVPMLAAARGGGGEVVRADALALPFLDGSFDLVVCQRFLFHVPHEVQGRVLRELARVSRRFVAVDVRHGRAWSALRRRVRGRLSGLRVSPRWSPSEIDARFGEAGLAVLGKAFGAPLFSEKVLVLAQVVRA